MPIYAQYMPNFTRSVNRRYWHHFGICQAYLRTKVVRKTPSEMPGICHRGHYPPPPSPPGVCARFWHMPGIFVLRKMPGIICHHGHYPPPIPIGGACAILAYAWHIYSSKVVLFMARKYAWHMPIAVRGGGLGPKLHQKCHKKCQAYFWALQTPEKNARQLPGI